MEKQQKVIVGRPINGIALNGNEWLLDDKDRAMVFDNKEKAKEFLTEQGYGSELEDNFVFEPPAMKQFEL